MCVLLCPHLAPIPISRLNRLQPNAMAPKPPEWLWGRWIVCPGPATNRVAPIAVVLIQACFAALVSHYSLSAHYPTPPVDRRTLAARRLTAASGNPAPSAQPRARRSLFRGGPTTATGSRRRYPMRAFVASVEFQQIAGRRLRSLNAPLHVMGGFAQIGYDSLPFRNKGPTKERLARSTPGLRRSMYLSAFASQGSRSYASQMSHGWMPAWW